MHLAAPGAEISPDAWMIGESYVRMFLRLAVMATAGTGSFLAVWWLAEVRLDLGRGVALAIAGGIGASLAAPLVWWASREPPKPIQSSSAVGRKRPWVGLQPAAADCFQRRRVIDAVKTALARRRVVVVTQVLSGMGGVGKTQVAACIARDMWADRSVDVVVWVSARNRAAIIDGYAQAAGAIFGEVSGEAELTARRFLEWLTTTDQRWLVVLDDLVDPADLRDWDPRSTATGRVVITTRRRDAMLSTTERTMIDVDLFTPSEAQAYLANKIGLGSIKLVEADLVARDLGYLPLALAQAAAFIKDRHVDCEAYRMRFADARTRLAELMPENSALPDNHRMTVAATWTLSVDLADELTPIGLARPMLELLSLLEPNGVPTVVLKSPNVLTYLDSYRSTVAQVTEVHILDSVHCLRRLNLLDLADAGAHNVVRVHALVQRATREQIDLAEAHKDAGIDKPRQTLAAQTLADALVHSWPSIERDAALSGLLRVNTEALRSHAEDALWTPAPHAILFRAGDSLGAVGLADAALTYWQQLYGEAERRLGTDHRATLSIRIKLVRWRGQAGHPAAAVAAFELLLPDMLRVLGPADPDVVEARSNLARWRGHAGDPAAAVSAFAALAQDLHRLFGPGDPRVLSARHNLAKWHGHAGEYTRAVAEFTDLLSDRLRILGPDHPDTLLTRHNVARWHGAAGDPERAVIEAEALLPDLVRILGPDHPDTLITRSSMSHWRARTSDKEHALADLLQLFADRLRVLGPDHPDTLTSRQEIAECRALARDTASALSDFEAILVDRIRVLGPHHPDTLTTRHCIARCLRDTGDTSGARSVLQQILTDRQNVLASSHPDLAATEDDIAALGSK